MSHIDTAIETLARPSLLTKAARIGARRYKRKKHLATLTPNGARMGQAALLKDLMEKENDLEWTRRNGAADYNVKRHVLILSALIAESRTPALELVQ